MRPFRFGVSILTATSRRDWQEKARRAEALGFDVLLVADHLTAMFPPLTALLSAAEATERLRVGTFVVNNDFRNPVLLAREAATIDLLSDGRFELGLGAGHMKFEYDEAGIRFDPPAVRVARLAESVQIVKQLLHGDTVHFTGEHYTVREHTMSPRPVQARVPILVGGNGRRVLRLAAQQADIVGFTGFSQVEGSRDVNLNHFTASGLERQIEWVRADAGERFEQLELNALIQRVDVTDGGSNDSPYLLAGSHERMAEALRERRERFGLSYFVVFEKAMTDFAPVIARLKPPTPG